LAWCNTLSTKSPSPKISENFDLKACQAAVIAQQDIRFVTRNLALMPKIIAVKYYAAFP
jgi:hypothetical protein